jgi:hypothetical protein
MHQAPPMFDTKPILRPSQVSEAKAEIASAQAALNNPSPTEDKAEVAKRLRRLTKTFNEQVPRAPTSSEEEGRMVSRSRALLSEILQGMPSQEEMRKAPPGAVDKHAKWERANKKRIQEWKNLQIRLTHGEEPEAANLERHRPTGSTLNMDNAYIQGKQIYIPDGVGSTVTFNDAQIAVLRMVSPQLADALSLMSNQQRAQVKEALTGSDGGGIGLAAERNTPNATGVVKVKAKRVMSEAQKAALAAGREKAKAARAAQKE